MINDHFQKIAITDEHRSATEYKLSSYSTASDPSQFSFPEISASTVLSRLLSLDTAKATGPDGLSARFLTEVSYEIVEPLTVLYNESLQTGIIPLEWKRSHITPVHKGGPADDVTNYRPIAVVSVVVKIVEKLVATELSRYLESTAQLHLHQAAYRLEKSTEDILRVAVDIISNSIDSGKTVCVAFLDLKKVFDSLDHCILLQTLSELGVSSGALGWFKDYL